MMTDLAALTPPLVMCVAFLIGVVVLVRRQLAPKPRSGSAAGEPAAETTRGPADPAYPAKPDRPVRKVMPRGGANHTGSAEEAGEAGEAPEAEDPLDPPDLDPRS